MCYVYVCFFYHYHHRERKHNNSNRRKVNLDVSSSCRLLIELRSSQVGLVLAENVTPACTTVQAGSR